MDTSDVCRRKKERELRIGDNTRQGEFNLDSKASTRQSLMLGWCGVVWIPAILY
jgi:hypothetical protein